MKTKFYLLISLILIALVAITTYTPQAAQAEVQTQEDPVSEAGEGPSRPDADNQINANQHDSFHAVGINFVPHDSALTYYNGAYGCLGSTYDGSVAKTFSIPVNVPDDVKGSSINFTYRNTVADPSNGPIEVSLWKRGAADITDTQELKKFTLSKAGAGGHFDFFYIQELTFDTTYSLYWLEFKLPPGAATREFCGAQIIYENPPLFPLALPMIQR
jgi:hypothetical protein